MADKFNRFRAEISNIDSHIQFSDYEIETSREDYTYFVGNPENGRPMRELTQSRRYVDLAGGLNYLISLLKKCGYTLIIGTSTYTTNIEGTETETIMTIKIFDGYL